MGVLKFIVLMLLVLPVSAKKIYVSNTGDNGNDGRSSGAAKQTLSAITAALIEPGDTVALECGGIWRETFTVPEAGTGTDINVLTHYGDTANGLPIISGADDISTASYAWEISSSGTNEYYVTASGGGTPSISSSPAIMFVDGMKVDSADGSGNGGELGSLWNLRFKYGDNDGLGFNTIYCRFNTGDPDVIDNMVEIPTSNFCISATATTAYWKYDGIIMEKSKSTAFRCNTTGTDSVVFANCVMRETYTAWFTYVDPASLWFISCKFKNCYASTNSGAIILSGTADNYTHFIQSSFEGMGYRGITPISTATNSSVDIINCTFYGSFAQMIYLSSSATTDVVIKNSIFLAPCINRLNDNPLDNSSSAGGSITISNSYWDVNSRNPSSTYSTKNVTIGTGNILTSTPKITSPRHKGYVYIQCDDDVNFMNYNTLSPFADEKNVRLSFGFSHPERVTSEMWDTLGNWLVRNQDISNHTMSHWYMSSYTAASIQYTGAGTACEMSIDTSAKTLATTVTGGPGGEDLNLDLTSYATVDDLTAAIDALTPYSASSKVGQTNCPLTDNFNSGRLLFRPHASVDIKTVDSLYWNYQRQYVYQINGAEQWIQDSLSYTPTTLVYPAGEYNDSLFKYMLLDGLNFGRAVDPVNYNINRVLDVLLMPTHNNTSVFEDDSAAASRGMAASINAASFTGSYIGAYSHFALDQTDLYKGLIAKLSELSDAGIVNASTTTESRSALEAIGESYEDGRYRQTYYADSTDLRLQVGTDHINKSDTTAISGIPNLFDLSGLQLTDETGALLIDSVNIGAYSTAGVTAQLDSISPDSVYPGELIQIYLRHSLSGLDSVKMGDSTISSPLLTDTTVEFTCPNLAPRWYLDTTIINYDGGSDTLLTDSIYVKELILSVSSVTVSTCSIAVVCTLSVTDTAADSIAWQIYSSSWSDSLLTAATGADTLFRTPSIATITDSIRAIVWNDTGYDTSAAVWWNPLWDDTARTCIVSPSTATVAPDADLQFTATFYDTIGLVTANHGAVSWSVDAGGSIGASTGLFTADSDTSSNNTVTATEATNSVEGTATVNVQNVSTGTRKSPWSKWGWYWSW